MGSRMIIDSNGAAKRGNRYSIPLAVSDAVLETPQGAYQEGLIHGREPWSGAGLSNAAKEWSSRYQTSRDNLCGRIAAAAKSLGWQARTQLVLVNRGGYRRWCRELVLTNPQGVQIIW